MHAGIEGGGTKFVCAVGRTPLDIVESVRIATTDPATTLAECVRFLLAAQKRVGPLASIGFSCFGPIDLRAGSASFGRMLPTPKLGWSGADLLAPLRAAFAIPIALDTDVGGAALAEWRLGAGRGLGSLVYVTVGTGIGGAMAPSDPKVGHLMHAEMATAWKGSRTGPLFAHAGAAILPSCRWITWAARSLRATSDSWPLRLR
jgi:fructokinase